MQIAHGQISRTDRCFCLFDFFFLFYPFNVVHPCIITWRKQTFLYFEVEAQYGINLIMFHNSSVRKKLKSTFLSNKPLRLQNRDYSTLNGTFPIELQTKHVFSKMQIIKNEPKFCFHTCTECLLSIQKSIPEVTLWVSTFCK